MYSSSLTNEEWSIVEPLLPKKKLTCPPKWTKRQILDGIFYQLKMAVIGGTSRKISRPTPPGSGIINSGEVRESSQK